MRALIPTSIHRLAMAGMAAAVVATMPSPALAQDEISESRLRKIESEIRALQRTVFPGGDGRFFEPQVAPGSSTGSAASPITSTTAVTDILARLDAMELQLQRLTALTEENSNSLSEVETRLVALEGAQTNVASTSTPSDVGAVDANLNAITGGASQPSASTSNAPAQVAGPSAERIAAVQEITKPQTDDAADDEYSYGFRLWNAGFYPEARQQLSSFVDQYPSHWRATFGRNLLGRAFLDDGMAEEAARWFLSNYQTDRQAARAPDSLLYLAESMIALQDTDRACIALAEFGETYPALASGRLADKYESNRQKVTCN
ncbi:MAG: tetratricopeptide repeat protein [Erythrobacter sp.]|uniref:tetratricopeptide repeat protein n=1 Tax=Marinobacter alexandrii TaxID=2570351 RepID=UPI0032970366